MLSTLKNLFLWEAIKKYLIDSIIYHKGFLKDVKDFQNRVLATLDDFKRYSPKKIRSNRRKKKEKLTNAERFYDYRKKVIVTFEDGVFPFNDEFQKNEAYVSNKKLPDWVRVDRTTFNETKDKVKKVKDKIIYVRPNRGFYISADDSYKLIQHIEYGEITHEKALKKFNDIRSDIEKISNQEKTKLWC